MRKEVRARVTPLTIVTPIAVCIAIGAFTYAVAMRAGYPPILATIVAGVIGLLWLGFFVGRLLG
jgi:hypothetical protein